MAPTIGRVALDNGFHGSIPGDWVAPPPQNIQRGKTLKDNRDEHLFPSQRSDRITTACIRNLVRKYVTLAKSNHPEYFKEEGYSPHSFRHSKAVHMLEAGVPLIYIRNFLGHESVQTTEIYYDKQVFMERKKLLPV